MILANHSSRFCFYRRLLLLRSHRPLESSHSVLHYDLDVVSVGGKRVVSDGAASNAGGQLKITLTIPLMLVRGLLTLSGNNSGWNSFTRETLELCQERPCSSRPFHRAGQDFLVGQRLTVKLRVLV
jgi:hypothetical protein